ncbi:class I SAM-dependent methyltransferase [Pseudothauera nasutitermitis]|uniref:Class I SAM-dependent methyltransferase n=1 Tax=Pseudothauera nasutitermitis TaxID=2565930 RepID=A0A4S4AVF4_9RHOO|nr:class I SAM-dependent methyltransferase [Pseudothauera nasutitermitis]THF64009.1 class I SAM-dependent methyltransferase [Pseudothauera nasutitermitis]
MYIISGKGTVAGVDLATYMLKKCQQRGVLWDNDLPEYTLDFLTQTPSVSKSIRQGKVAEVVSIFNRKLKEAESNHGHYMLLCLTAHQLIPKLNTKLKCINLWDSVAKRIEGNEDRIAFIGTLECLPKDTNRFVTLSSHSEKMGDLITSVKRGYAGLGENYAAHPKRLLKRVFDDYQALGIKKFFLACTDLHLCKQYLHEFGVHEEDIIDILEIAGDAVLARNHQKYEADFLDEVSDARAHFRYKYVDHSDSLHTDTKTDYYLRLLESLCQPASDTVNILDIGGSSTGHSIALAKKFAPCKCHVTLQDISQSSLDAARHLYANLSDISFTFECGDIATFDDGKKYDAVLCLGVLLHVSSDQAFDRVVRKISDLTKSGGIVITRDCLAESERKIYMSFGGVIRNEALYISTFESAGLKLMEQNSFIIEQPIRRKIKSIVWGKR